jgi:hypothetical protein
LLPSRSYRTRATGDPVTEEKPVMHALFSLHAKRNALF